MFLRYRIFACHQLVRDTNSNIFEDDNRCIQEDGDVECADAPVGHVDQVPGSIVCSNPGPDEAGPEVEGNHNLVGNIPTPHTIIWSKQSMNKYFGGLDLKSSIIVEWLIKETLVSKNRFRMPSQATNYGRPGALELQITSITRSENCMG